MHEWGGTIGMGVAVLGVCTAILQSRLNRRVALLLCGGLLLRVFGALTYIYLIGSYYGGGDYLYYFEEGRSRADDFWQSSNKPYLEWQGKWWGTSFVVRATGILVAVIGPSLPAVSVAYALIGFAGTAYFAVAFRNAYPSVALARYLVWLAVFPSLWFWPAAIGKDALVLCGLGMATYGFIGRGDTVRWMHTIIGTALVFAVRPQVAAVLACAFVVGQVMGSSRRWGVARSLQAGLFIALGVGVLSLSGGALGIELFQADQVEGYMESRSTTSAYGGSSLNVEEGVSLWMAPINVLLRPFPWESGGITTRLASMEVLALWISGWLFRKRIRSFFAAHNNSKLRWIAISFVALYAISLGMSLGNLGIVARQRVHLLPFVFAFFAGASDVTRRPSNLYLLGRMTG